MPKSIDQMLKERNREEYYIDLGRRQDRRLHDETARKVLKNVYRNHYGVPEDLMVRKADKDMRAAVKSSEAL